MNLHGLQALTGLTTRANSRQQLPNISRRQDCAHLSAASPSTYRFKLIRSHIPPRYLRLDRIGNGANTRYRVDIDAIKQWFSGCRFCWQLFGRKSSLPPEQTFFENPQSMQTFGAKLRRIRQLLISAGDNHALPLIVVYYFVYFHAHFRVLAHPFNLTADRCETIQLVRFIGKVNRHHVRLIVLGAS